MIHTHTDTQYTHTDFNGRIKKSGFYIISINFWPKKVRTIKMNMEKGSVVTVRSLSQEDDCSEKIRTK